MERKDLWQSVLGELEGNLSRANFRMWFRDTFIAEDTGETVTIGVPNNFYLGWIREKFHKNIAETMRRVRPSIREITYKVIMRVAIKPLELKNEPGAAPRETDNLANISMPASSNRPIQSMPNQETAASKLNSSQYNSSFQPVIANLEAAALTPQGESPLDNNHTFDSFIVGNSNRLAHAVSLAAAAEPGTKYNPLFIYGGAGLGKTHLAQAIGNAMRQKNPLAKIAYLSCESFTNEFIEALQKKSLESFKKRFRNCDALLIDDVQFMSGKERTQEEFFHTFNALHQAKKQIVLTSDREPQNIPSMEDRLTSRFAWGMVADIQPPDLETRIAILRAKCQERGYSLANEPLEMLAQLIVSNIRELEGGLQQLVTRAEIDKRELTAQYVIEIFSGVAGANRSRGLSAKRVVDIVSEFFELKSEELLGSRRYKELVYPRQLAMYLIRHELSFSYPKIGKELGGKDHTTIMHGVNKIEKELARNANIQYDLTKLKERLYAGIER